MIKTPVKKPERSFAEGFYYFIYDAAGEFVCATDEEHKDQIVSALNAQQPTCETCGGSGVITLRVSIDQQPKGITGNMQVEKSSMVSRIDYEVIIARQHARIESLEKGLQEIKQYAYQSHCGDSNEHACLYKIANWPETTLGKEQKNERE